MTDVRHPNGAPALDDHGRPLDDQGHRVPLGPHTYWAEDDGDEYDGGYHDDEPFSGPRVVPDVAGLDVVSGHRGRPGAAHATYSEPGYHHAPVHVSGPLRALWHRLRHS